MPRELLRKISRLVRSRKIEAAVLSSLPRPLRRALRRRRYRKWVRRCAARPTPPVLVYTTMKVASTAVSDALRSIEGMNVFQIHLINAEGMARVRAKWLGRRGAQA